MKFPLDQAAKVIFLFGYVFVSSLVILYFQPIYLITVISVIGVPSVINYLWLKKSQHKVMLFSLVATFLFAPAVELAARVGNLWDVQTVFPRPFGLVPLENLLFAFFNFFWVLSFYEYFVDRDRNRTIAKRLKSLAVLFIIFSIIVFSLFFTNPDWLKLSYLAISIPLLVIPSIIIYFQRPILIQKTYLPTVFFFFVFFVYEMVAIQIGNWWWPSEYFWPIQVNGKVFPVDDVIVWYLMSTPALIGGYEYFTDDFR